jgi:UDP-glucose 4-epimerase
MKRWLVTGGAGYIGSHVAHDLVQAGADVVVLDDLSTGFESYIPKQATFIKANVNETEKVAAALKGCYGVVHLAGYKFASESTKFPLLNYRSNIAGSISLLEAMKQEGVHNILFSSSAGIYGNLKELPATEESEVFPESPYATSKYIVEQIINDAALAKDPDFPLQAMSLRYFNVAGTGIKGLADKSPFSLFSIVMNKFANGESPNITGSDFATPDGTPIRDYIHVSDVSSAHVAAAKKLETDKFGHEVINLSTGVGISVLEVMNEFKRQLGENFTFGYADRRPGDPAASYGDATKAKNILNWSAKYDLTSMVSSVTNPESI